MQLLQKDKNKLNESFINAQIDVLDNSGPFTLMFILIEFISQIMDENLFVNHIVLHVSVLGLFLTKK
jgi:hypothetical protein